MVPVNFSVSSQGNATDRERYYSLYEEERKIFAKKNSKVIHDQQYQIDTVWYRN